ncbi:MAG: protein SCO1/2 [Pseudohongiellaceae bacterium]|jgi:protein SCO1/2
MALSLRAKRALIAFGIFDIAVIAALIFLFVLKSEIDLKDELREIGVTVFADNRPIQEFDLVDENLAVYTSENLKDRWTLLFFGFTSCPDICPITMSELKKFYEQLDPNLKDDLSIVMVSVDPERDDPETIGNYVNGFNEEFLGVTGNLDSIAGVASQFFVGYSDPVYPSEIDNQSQEQHQHGQEQVTQQQQDPHHGAVEHSSVGDSTADDSTAGHSTAAATSAPAIEEYLISHSGHLAIVNPDGNYHAVMRPPHRVRDLLKAYEIVRDSSDF